MCDVGGLACGCAAIDMCAVDVLAHTLVRLAADWDVSAGLGFKNRGYCSRIFWWPSSLRWSCLRVQREACGLC